jgi:hypothetical protein
MALIALTTSLHAATVGVFDTSSLSFEMTYSGGSAKTASGTANGIGYDFSAASSFYKPFSNTTSNQSFNDLPGKYDDIHAGADFTITFETPVKSILFAFANDNRTGDGPDFGLTPSYTTGITQSGTQLKITDIGGALVLFEFANAISSITHTNKAIGDGWDMAFFASTESTISAVPVPSAALLFLPALIGFMSLRRK